MSVPSCGARRRVSRSSSRSTGRPVAQLGPLSGPQRPAHPDALRHLLADTPVDRAWADELAAMRVEDDDAAADPRRG
jgi:hypothetical protein